MLLPRYSFSEAALLAKCCDELDVDSDFLWKEMHAKIEQELDKELESQNLGELTLQNLTYVLAACVHLNRQKQQEFCILKYKIEEFLETKLLPYYHSNAAELSADHIFKFVKCLSKIEFQNL